MFDMDESTQKNSTASLDLLSSKVSEYKGFSHVSSLWNSQCDGVATIQIESLRKYLTLNFRGCLSCSARNFLK